MDWLNAISVVALGITTATRSGLAAVLPPVVAAPPPHPASSGNHAESDHHDKNEQRAGFHTTFSFFRFPIFDCRLKITG